MSDRHVGWAVDNILEGNSEFEAEVVDSIHVQRLVLVGCIAVVDSELETKVSSIEWEPCEADLWRHVESPVVSLAYKCRHVCALF